MAMSSAGAALARGGSALAGKGAGATGCAGAAGTGSGDGFAATFAMLAGRAGFTDDFRGAAFGGGEGLSSGGGVAGEDLDDCSFGAADFGTGALEGAPLPLIGSALLVAVLDGFFALAARFACVLLVAMAFGLPVCQPSSCHAPCEDLACRETRASVLPISAALGKQKQRRATLVA
jgi:hypothetical protein